MAQTDALKKYLDAGMAFTALTRSRAEQVVKELVAAGELQRNQTKGAIDELVERSKKNAETLSEQVRKEVDSQLSGLGLARKADVEKLEAELAKLKGEEPAKAKAAEKAQPTGKTTKAPAKAAKAAKAAKKSGARESAGAVGALPGREAAASDDEKPAKKPAKRTTKKQG